MNEEFINITTENLENEHISCIIRSKKPHEGISEKKQWLANRLEQGHVFRKLNVKTAVFIEYAPVETAWVPIKADNYLYIYCLWVTGEYTSKGYGKALMQYCIDDAKRLGKSGVCMLGAIKQKAWLSDQSFAKHFGFSQTDCTPNGYELLSLSFDDTKPKFCENAKKETIDNPELTVYYDMQCPYIPGYIKDMREYCSQNNIPASFIKVTDIKQAKSLPCVFNNFAMFYKGKLININVVNSEYLKRKIK